MRVYNLTSQTHAISNIRNRHIKISRLGELNDPYELLGIQMPDRQFRQAYEATRKHLNNQFGVVCFSQEWSNPVLWSHYGDKHYGICLGFDVPPEHLDTVEYVEHMLPFDLQTWSPESPVAEDQMKRLLVRKFKDWYYENEFRSWVGLDEPDPQSGHYFLDFSGRLILREVILGPRCAADRKAIKKALAGYEHRVEVIKARLAFNSYQVVRNKKFKPISAGA